MKKSVLNMNIHTQIEEAGEIIRNRWANKDLRKAVEEKLHNNIPEILKDGPVGMIGRCVDTPDGEFERFLELCKKADIKPVCFEYIKDRFYPGNFTKYGLTNLTSCQGVDKKQKKIVVKEKIINFEEIKGKKFRMCDLKTLWGENLVDFHHFILLSIFPIMTGRIIDTSDWFPKSENWIDSYYNYVLSLSICHLVLFDDFDLTEEDEIFTNERVCPIIKKIEKDFGVKPVIIKISKVGEHIEDPYWWSYSKEARKIMDNHIKTFKC